MSAALLASNPRFAPGQLGVEQARRARLAAAYRRARDLEGVRNWYDAGIAFTREQDQHRAAEATWLEGNSRQPEPFEPGDHLQVWRNGIYHHDGTYLWNEWVVQYGGGVAAKPNATVHCVPLSEFARGGNVEVVRHSGQDREATIRRALQLLSCPPPMSYDLFGNNCEHNARWCATSNFDSRQVTAGITLGGGLGAILMLAEGYFGPLGTLIGMGLGLLVLVMISASIWGVRAFQKHVVENGLG